mgnify:CR=1 FL=1
MIVITGASGKLGRAIVSKLLTMVDPSTVAASVRDPAKAADLQALGVRLHMADYEDQESLKRAFDGTAQVLMISSNAAAYGRDPLSQHARVIEAARAAGVGRLVYTSHMASSPTSRFSPMAVHDQTEKLLASSGLAWTALRNGYYADSILSMIRQGLQARLLSLPVDGKVNWTAHADLAEAAAIVLSQSGRFDGPTPPLAPAEALDLAEIARLASEITGTEIRREEIPDEEMAARLRQAGMPAAVIEITLGMYRASRAGEFATNNATLTELLGRPTTPFRSMLAAQLQG